MSSVPHTSSTPGWRPGVWTVLLTLAVAGCSSSDAPPTATPDSGSAGCSTSQALPGTSYDITKSRFAFGGAPSSADARDGVHYTGPDGALAIFSNGYAQGELDGNAPENDLPPLSATTAMLTSYVEQYYQAMSVARCQIASSAVLGYQSGGVGTFDGGEPIETTGPVTVGLSRGVHGIPVEESLASAIFDSDNQTISEDFYWPTIPAAVVTAAVAFQAKLAEPSALDAYKAKLPANARGQGQVAIHHTEAVFHSAKFEAVATYDVDVTGDAGDGVPNLSFDEDAKPVTLPE